MGTEVNLHGKPLDTKSYSLPKRGVGFQSNNLNHQFAHSGEMMDCGSANLWLVAYTPGKPTHDIPDIFFSKIP